MKSIADIRHKVKTIEDTRKITRAMYMISSAKMKRAMRMHELSMKYFDLVRLDIKFILENAGGSTDNPYYRFHPGRNVGYIIIGGDKGLCGGYNAEVIRLATQSIEHGDYQRDELFPIGNVVSDHFARTNLLVNQDYRHMIQDPSLNNARLLTYELCERFRRDELDEVYIVYTHLDRMSVLCPTLLRILPVLPEDFMNGPMPDRPVDGVIFHPSVESVLESRIPEYLIGLVYSTLVQAYACEHYARMTAMDNSNRNAQKMLDHLMLEQNYARQTVVTEEITEIISGSSGEW